MFKIFSLSKIENFLYWVYFFNGFFCFFLVQVCFYKYFLYPIHVTHTIWAEFFNEKCRIQSIYCFFCLPKSYIFFNWVEFSLFKTPTYHSTLHTNMKIWYLFRDNLENCRFLGVAYPPNIFL